MGKIISAALAGVTGVAVTFTIISVGIMMIESKQVVNDATKAKTECEKSLPRDQYCAVVVTAVPVAKKEQ